MSRLRVLAAASALVVTLAASGCGGDGGEGEVGAGPDLTTGLPAPAPSTTTTAAPAETTTTPAPTTTTPEPEVVEVVMGPSKVTFTYPAGLSESLRSPLDTYLDYITFITFAGDQMGPVDTEIDRLTTGDLNRAKKDYAAARSRDGSRYFGEIVSHPRVLSSAEDHVLIHDCTWDLQQTVTVSGEVLSAPDPHPQLQVAELVLTTTGWKVSAYYRTEKPCVGSQF